MMRILFVLTLSSFAAFAQFAEGATRSLYYDIKAFRKGDIVTRSSRMRKQITKQRHRITPLQH
jgi:hypothetical protein